MPKNTTKVYADLRAAEQVVCYTAFSFIRGGCGRSELRSAVNQWSKAAEGVGKLAFTAPAPDEVRGGGGGVNAGGVNAVAVDGSLFPSNEAEDGKETTKSKAITPHHFTWLTPYGNLWTEYYRGSPNYGLLAKALAPLVKQHGNTEVLMRWEVYLSETPGRYASPLKFAATWGEWDPVKVKSEKDPKAPRPGETSDQYLARVGNG